MIDNIMITTLPDIPWVGDRPELSGLLVFDATGALLGAGLIVPDPKDEEASLVQNRWALGTIDYDWATLFTDPEAAVLAEMVTHGVVVMLQATVVQLGKIWGENESKWVGRMEGAMAVLDRLGVQNEQTKPTGEPHGKSVFIAPRG
jgi:hypothetical protein